MIYTVFPKNNEDLPQDFPTLKQAREYGDEFFGPENYEVESTSGEVL